MVQCQQGGEKLVVAQVRLPAVGGENGGIQLLVREVQPRRALVVEARQVPGLAVLPRQPFVALGDQFPRGVGNVLPERGNLGRFGRCGRDARARVPSMGVNKSTERS